MLTRKFSVNLIWRLSPYLFVDLFTSSYWRRRGIYSAKKRNALQYAGLKSHAFHDHLEVCLESILEKNCIG